MPSDEALDTGRSVQLSIRPEYLQIGLEPSGGIQWEGTVETPIFYGFYQVAELRIGTERLQARVNPSLDLAPGKKVYVSVDPGHCVICR